MDDRVQIHVDQFEMVVVVEYKNMEKIEFFGLQGLAKKEMTVNTARLVLEGILSCVGLVVADYSPGILVVEQKITSR